jgi:hypothetical protein
MRTRLLDARIEGRHLGAHGFQRQAQRQAGIGEQVTGIVRGQDGHGQRGGAAVDECRGILGLEIELDRPMPASSMAWVARMRWPWYITSASSKPAMAAAK